MPLTPVITTRVSITVNSILNVFENVIGLNFDYYKGMVNIVNPSGSFYFGLTTLTTVTYTIAGSVTTVVIS